MNSQHLVHRMITSITTKKGKSTTVDDYLKVFGVTSTSDDLPIVFDKKFESQWKAFLLDRKYSSTNPRLRLLLTILDYIKFMRSQKVNPFVTVNKKTLNSVIRPVDMTKNLLKEDVTETWQAILNYLRKAGVLSFLTVSTRVTQLSLDRKSININLSMSPIRKQSLDEVIKNLYGTLYRDKVPPKQLQPHLPANSKSFRSTVSTINTSPSEWLPLTSINNFKIYARMTKDALAIRITLPVDKDFVKTSTDLQRLCTLYKTVK